MTPAPVASSIRAVAVAADTGVSVAWSDRATGNLSTHVGGGDVATGRARLLAAVGSSVPRSVWMEQVHGGVVAVVGDDDAGRGAWTRADAVGGVDALVTTATDLALVAVVADCVPVGLVAPGAGIAAVHAGRPGVAAEVVTAAVAALADAADTPPDDMVAVVGPAVGACCYEVPEEMARSVTAVVPAAAATTTWGTPSLDLPGAVAAQLAAAGVTEVIAAGTCTRCDPATWFSHRASTADAGIAEGRQGLAIVRAPVPVGGSVDAGSLHSAR